jgi:hypothetical protein
MEDVPYKLPYKKFIGKFFLIKSYDKVQVALLRISAGNITA